MRAAVVGVVEHVHIARLHGGSVFTHHGFDTFAHRAQVHGHVRCIGNEVTGSVKQSAAKVQALFDVHRVSRVLQLQAHLLGNVHKQVVKHLQQHGVYGGAHRELDCTLLGAQQVQVVKLGERGLPAGLYHGGGVLLGNDGGAGDDVAGAQVFTHHQGGLYPLAARIHTHGFAYCACCLEVTHGVHGVAWLFGGVTRNHGLYRYRFHDQAFAFHQESKTLAIRGLKGGHDQRGGGGVASALGVGHDQSGVATFVTHVNAAVGGNGTLVDLLACEFAFGLCGQRINFGDNGGQSVGGEFYLYGLFADHGLVGQAHAVGAEHAGQWVHKHARHAQCVSHQAGVLTTRTAKALQGVAGHVVTAGHRDFLDGVGHLLHGDVNKAFRHFFGRALGLLCELAKLGLHGFQAQGFVRIGAKHFGEEAGLNFAHHHVGIGHRQRAATAVASGAGVGTCALGSHTET